MQALSPTPALDGVEPLFDRVLVLEDTAQKQTASGIVLPESAIGRVTTGVVVKVGGGTVTKIGTVRQIIVATGDRVQFKIPCGTRVEIDGAVYLLMRESDIQGIIS